MGSREQKRKGRGDPAIGGAGKRVLYFPPPCRPSASSTCPPGKRNEEASPYPSSLPSRPPDTRFKPTSAHLRYLRSPGSPERALHLVLVPAPTDGEAVEVARQLARGQRWVQRHGRLELRLEGGGRMEEGRLRRPMQRLVRLGILAKGEGDGELVPRVRM